MSEAKRSELPAGRWGADISLGFGVQQKRTVLSSRQHSGPLRVQKPFYPEGDVCHVYLLHPPGGMTGHDDLNISIDVPTDASALVTTPASNKAYRSAGPKTWVRQSFHAGGTLEWLPQSTILFGGSRLRQRTDIHLSPSSRLMAWDLIGLGRPASDDHYDDHHKEGEFEQVQSVFVQGRPLFRDRQRFFSGARILDAAWGYGGAKALGVFLIFPADEDLLERVRHFIGQLESDLTATMVDKLLVIRGMSQDLTQLQEEFARVWACLRPMVLGRPASVPRIWAT
ncbi:MAG: urease accessory protein UreD [Pseudomonadota bacterium]